MACDFTRYNRLFAILAASLAVVAAATSRVDGAQAHGSGEQPGKPHAGAMIEMARDHGFAARHNHRICSRCPKRRRSSRRRLRISPRVAIKRSATVSAPASKPGLPGAGGQQVYLGATVGASVYGEASNPPWNMKPLETF